MWHWFRRWQAQWEGWISDSDLERAMRAKLTAAGYYGDTAKFRTFRLVAVKRPGWEQVFSFSVDARIAKQDERDREIVKLFGLVRQDERYHRCDIEVFRDALQRNKLYATWAENMSQLRRLADNR
jgi:hypothetical protein